MKGNAGTKRILKISIILLIIAVMGYGGYTYYHIMQSSKHAAEVLSRMELLIPNLGVDTGVSKGLGRDPLPVISIDQIDIAGCIEASSIDLKAPVTAEGYEEEGFATIAGGSPVKGKFKLTGGRDGVFRKLSKAKPGDLVAFTDVDGVRYNYRVLTQFHLKEWDEADQDLMLCYRTDDQTQFVLGCKKAD